MRNNFESDFAKSRRRFNFMFKIVMAFTALVFILILVYWGLIGFVAVKAVDAVSGADPKEVAKGLGELVNSFNEGMNK